MITSYNRYIAHIYVYHNIDTHKPVPLTAPSQLSYASLHHKDARPVTVDRTLFFYSESLPPLGGAQNLLKLNVCQFGQRCMPNVKSI